MGQRSRSRAKTYRVTCQFPEGLSATEPGGGIRYPSCSGRDQLPSTPPISNAIPSDLSSPRGSQSTPADKGAGKRAGVARGSRTSIVQGSGTRARSPQPRRWLINRWPVLTRRVANHVPATLSISTALSARLRCVTALDELNRGFLLGKKKKKHVTCRSIADLISPP